MKRVALALLALGVCLRAETLLLTFDSSGALLAQSQAVFRKGGLAMVPRESLKKVATAQILDEDGHLHPILWITADDKDSSVVEVYVGAQAPKGPDSASSMSRHVKMAGHEANVKTTREAGGYGFISRLDCGGPQDTAGGPLYDEHGLLAGWHAVRFVDGQALAFGIPLSRLESLSQTLHLSLKEWNDSLDPAKEAPYQRAMGHLWIEDFDGALFYFQKATELDPANPRAWYHLAFAEGKNGHTKSKLACYRKAVELDPAFAPAHYYLGFSLLMAGDRNGAVGEYQRLRELDDAWAARLKLFLDAAHVDVLEKGKVRDVSKRMA
jgi:tetratricopeptide (TPR) repeat protein